MASLFACETQNASCIEAIDIRDEMIQTQSNEIDACWDNNKKLQRKRKRKTTLSAILGAAAGVIGTTVILK
jgi:hypothetical protein